MSGLSVKDVDRAGTRLAYDVGNKVYVRSLDDWAARPRLVGTHSTGINAVAFHPDGGQLAAIDRSGEIRLWPTAGRSEGPLRVLDGKGTTQPPLQSRRSMARSIRRCRRIPGAALGPSCAFLDRTPATAKRFFWAHGYAFDPGERWLATAPAALWPLAESYPRTLKKHKEWVNDVAFSTDAILALVRLRRRYAPRVDDGSRPPRQRTSAGEDSVAERRASPSIREASGSLSRPRLGACSSFPSWRARRASSRVSPG